MVTTLMPLLAMAAGLVGVGVGAAVWAGSPVAAVGCAAAVLAVALVPSPNGRRVATTAAARAAKTTSTTTTRMSPPRRRRRPRRGGRPPPEAAGCGPRGGGAASAAAPSPLRYTV